MVKKLVNTDIADKMDIEKKIWHVRKLYIDPAGGLIYCLGCSLVHLSLLIGALIVKKPNITAAKKLDLQYQGFLKEIPLEQFCARKYGYLAINQIPKATL